MIIFYLCDVTKYIPLPLPPSCPPPSLFFSLFLSLPVCYPSALPPSPSQLKACEEELRRLEQAVECPSDPTRLRLLPGENPSCNELREKIERLEVGPCL